MCLISYGRAHPILTNARSISFRGFNDAINGFNDDGWTVLNCDGAEDIILAVNSPKNLNASSSAHNPFAFLGGILCAKASMLLQVRSFVKRDLFYIYEI